MKVKIKATGEYIEVEQRGPTFLNTNDGSLYKVEELDLNVIDDMMSEQEKWYWKDKRIDAAIAAMQAELSNPNNKFMVCEDKRDIITRRAVGYADALIAKLQKKDDNANIQQ